MTSGDYHNHPFIHVYCLRIRRGPDCADAAPSPLRRSRHEHAVDVPPVRAQADFEIARQTDLPVSGVTVHHLTFRRRLKRCIRRTTRFTRSISSAWERAVPRGSCWNFGRRRWDGPEHALLLAQNKVAALFVRMAYYGPRSPKTERVRLLSTNIPRTMDAVRQTVLDCRRATAWLESRPEIDAKKLGIVGTSLGSFLAAMTAEMEPKLNKIALLYGGGGFVDAYYDHPKAKPLVEQFEKLGGTKTVKAIRPDDLITCAATRRAACVRRHGCDDIVPPQMAKALWKASGEPKIVWYDSTHYWAVLRRKADGRSAEAFQEEQLDSSRRLRAGLWPNAARLTMRRSTIVWYADCCQHDSFSPRLGRRDDAAAEKIDERNHPACGTG